MIYLVSRNQGLFESTHYQTVAFDEAMKILLPLKEVQLDTETTGLDPHTKQLLTIQLGCRENQVVFDWLTLSVSEKAKLKEYLESGRLFIGWNLLFDLGFLYVNNIWVKNVWDGMIAEQLLFLGYDSEEHSMSLKAAAMFYLNYDLDKTVRGKIINVGLTEEVVVYAAGDVMFLEDIKDLQMKAIEAQGMQQALKLENAFIPSLAYFKHCGVLLDVPRWRKKMEKDLLAVKEAEQKLNDWVIDWCLNNGDHGNGAYEVEYIDTWNMDNYQIQEKEAKIIKKKYKRWPQGDAQGPGSVLRAYRKPMRFIRQVECDLFAENPYEVRYECSINWSSAQQVIPFFKKLGIDTSTFDKKTKKKKDTVSKNVLKPQKNKFPIIPIFLAYKAAIKLTSTYGQNWIDAINPVTGRIHVEFHSIGTDTARVSSGGGVYKLNLQNLPHDKETRACFKADAHNKWISADYQSQESRIIASVSQDEAMIDLFENGCGDVHSLVAKMSYPNMIPSDTRVEDISDLYHDQRQDAKGIEFAINYGGDANTIKENKGIPMEEAQQIYDNFMKGFPGVKRYQDYCRMAVIRDGYILMNPQTGHRCHIPDWEDLAYTKQKMQDPDFWAYYREMKRDAPDCDTVQRVKEFFKRKSDLEKNSINYRIQNRGACCFKLSSIKLFNWIRDNNYLNVVKMCVPVHDEFNLECPEELADQVSDVLVKCMVAGGKPFCPNVYLGADVGIFDHWVH